MTKSEDRVASYAHSVLAGEEVAGPHVRNSCQRHLDDLEKAGERGLRFDHDLAGRALRFFETRLFLSEGQFEGRPFQAHPSQAFVIGSLFGWVREDGTRRFRRAYIEQGKGNGKSPLAGGIGLYGLTADNEPGAQIYAAAAKKDQAGILFQDAVKMARQSPALSRILQMSGGIGREYNMAYVKQGSFFRPISRDAGKTGSGPRPHMALCDEVHEHPDRQIMEMLERGFKFRRQPLLLMITNSGTDRNSVCWEEHEHAVKVAAGNYDAKDDDAAYLGEVIDDTTFSYVCALDGPRTAVYSFDIALRHALDSCTCNAPIILTDLPSPQDFAALAIQRSGAPTISPKDLGASITPTVRLLLDGFAILATQRDASSAAQKLLSDEKRSRGLGPSLRMDLQRLANGTESIGNVRPSPTPRGSSTAPASQNTGSLQSKSLRSATRKAVDVESAGTKRSVSGWITATLQEMFGDCSAIPAMQELVCSEIISLLYSAHSTTCETHQRFLLQSGQLAEKLPGDDPLTDPTCWAKANPLLGVTITEEYLAGVVAQAKAMPGKLNGILRLHFCKWTDAETAWITRETLEPCIADFDPLDLHLDQPVWVGCDLSQNRDITALACVVRTGEVEVEAERDGKVQTVTKPTYDAWVEAWTPGDTLAGRALRDKQPYEQWVDAGFLNAPNGESIRFDHVAQALAEYAHDYEVKSVAYDRYAFRSKFEPECDRLGISVEFIEHPQGGTKKGKPTDAMKANGVTEGLWMPGSLRELEDAILERRIRLRRNPVLISAMMSAVTDEDRWGNRWLAKERAVNKIDAAVALCMAIGAAAMNTEPAYTSPWDDPNFSLVTTA